MTVYEPTGVDVCMFKAYQNLKIDNEQIEKMIAKFLAFICVGII